MIFQIRQLGSGIFFRPHLLFVSAYRRRCSTGQNKIETSKEITNQSVTASNNYVTVYKFPYIRHVAAFNKLKIYQSILAPLGFSTSLFLVEQGVVGSEIVSTVASLGISLCILLFGLGVLTDKFIGFVYYDEKKEYVKIAYVDYWGRRKEKMCH
ncbi:hypothetical protein HHI36_014325 [Cryptolaemus montrouzieri]|uniref:Transmembrane protein 186 n=1 Tax=Cryptolaemus montrouzieri TaxID=559131 RepID=A0ABD2N2J5_9CUCU